MIACVIHQAKDLKVEKRPEPQPGAGEVIIRFGAGGICGSDLHYYHEGRVGSFELREPLTTVPDTLAAYKRLNQLALELIAEDGILVSCSCSYHLSAEELLDAAAKAARGANRHLQVLELGGQAPDHPVHPSIPETRYLKAYFCRVNESLK